MGKEQELRLDPEAMTAAYEAHRAHASDPGRKGSGIEKAITAYLAAETARRSSSDEAEVVGWRWKLSYDERWFYADEKPSLSPHDLERVLVLAPLYASPSGVKAGVTEEMVERETTRIAKEHGCDRGTFTVCWPEHEKGATCTCKVEARLALRKEAPDA